MAAPGLRIQLRIEFSSGVHWSFFLSNGYETRNGTGFDDVFFSLKTNSTIDWLSALLRF